MLLHLQIAVWPPAVWHMHLQAAHGVTPQFAHAYHHGVELAVACSISCATKTWLLEETLQGMHDARVDLLRLSSSAATLLYS